MTLKIFFGNPTAANVVSAVGRTTDTWNPSDKATDVTLTDGDLTAYTANNSAGLGARSIVGHDAGKYYVEITPDVIVVYISLGLLVPGGSLESPTSDPESIGITHVGQVGQGGSIVHDYPPGTLDIAVGEALGIAVDFDAGKVWFRDSAGWQGDPVAGTGNVVSFTPNTTFHVGCTLYDAEVTANFGASAFAYPIPSGFSAWARGGVGSADAVGEAVSGAISAAVGSASGTGVASVVGTAIHDSIAAAAGTSTAEAAGAQTAAATGTAAGTGAANATGTAITPAVADAAGTGAAAGVASVTADATASAAGTGAASASSEQTSEAVGNAGGTGTATAISEAGSAVGSAAGTGAAAGIGAFTGVSEGIGNAAGVGAANAVGVAVGGQVPIFGGGGILKPPLRLRPVVGVGYGVLPPLWGEAHGVVGVESAGAAALAGFVGRAAGSFEPSTGVRSALRLTIKATAPGECGQRGGARAVVKGLAATGAGTAGTGGAGSGVIVELKGAAVGHHHDDEGAIVAWLLAA